MKNRNLQTIAILCALAILIFIPAPLRAAPNASIAVTTTADVVDANGGACSGLTIAMLPGADNVISLREAVCAANATSGADSITLGAGTFTLTTPGEAEYDAATGDLNVQEDLTVTGAGASSTIIDGGGLDRIFHSGANTPAANFSLTGVTLIHGSTDNGGGAIYFANANKTLTLQQVTLQNNTALSGGAIRAEQGTVKITSSTVISNSAMVGAGISVLNANAYLTNVTLSGNSALDYGGGFENSGTTVLANVTLTNNYANDGGGIYVNAGSVTVKNSIIAGNRDDNNSAPDCNGALVSAGYNLLGKSDGCTGLSNSVNGDKVGTNAKPLNPVLGALADNGGTTLTHALYTLSPAIDAGNPAGCTDAQGNALTTDQRGTNRALDGNGDSVATCDGGAFEYDRAVCTGLKPNPGEFWRLRPANGSTLVIQRVTLDWSDVNCETKFKLVVRQAGDCLPQNCPVVFKRKRLKNSEFLTPLLERGYTYYWLIKACNGNGCVNPRVTLGNPLWYSFTIRN